MKLKLLRTSATLLAMGASATLGLGQNKLVGRAVLPAKTYSPGPASGKYIAQGLTNGQTAPFPGQPVQGISALLDNHDGSFMAMPDNGYGSIETSADFYLRVYRLKPTFKKATGGSGALEMVNFIELNDADKKIPFAIVNDFTPERKLTGADFDVESIQRAADSTYWIGDEFGPFLLHFDKTGKLLDAPIELPDYDNAGKFVRSPQSPMNEEGSALRLMNAYRTHAQLHGNTKAPVFSPNASLIDDLDTATAAGNRRTPTDGLAKASTDLFNVSLLKAGGYPVVAWTVNDSATMIKLMNLGVNGIISDYPDLLTRLVSKFDKNKDGQPDFLDQDGLIDIKKFDAQGHRGARGLRPENTIPAFEFALDHLVTTLEFDCGVTADKKPVLSHDPFMQAAKARKADGSAYNSANEIVIKDVGLAELQQTLIFDKLLGGTWTAQNNDTTLSPVAVAFMKSKGLRTYAVPSLEQVFDFVVFYVEYYTTGAGSAHADAMKRAKNAARVRFNVETKLNPRTDTDEKGLVFIDRTVPADTFAAKVAQVIVAKGLSERADIQSFAFSTLLSTQKNFPSIRTVYLWTDSPRTPSTTNDGGNLQPQGGNKSPWLAGLWWPYRSTKQSNPMRAQRSGGFEGMALNISKDKLWPLLELPLAGDDSKTIRLHEFDLATKAYTGLRYKYRYNQGGTNIGDFCMYNENDGLIIERDNNQGPPSLVKKIYKVTFNNTDTLTKTLVVDLLDLQDADNLSDGLGTQADDYGIGTAYKFPYQTIESVVVLDSTTLVTINDNNYPFSVGRHVGNTTTTADDTTDDNEMIMVKLDAAHQLGHVVVTDLEDENGLARIGTGISNFPNPFSHATSLSIRLGASSEVSVEVLNLLGEVVYTEELGNLSAGYHSVELQHADTLKNGIYTIKMKANGKEYITKAIKTH